MTDPDSHRERRHLVRHVLASSHIDQAKPLIADQVRKCMKWVARSQGQSVEVMLLLRRLMLDTAGRTKTEEPIVGQNQLKTPNRSPIPRSAIWSPGERGAAQIS